MTSPTRDLTVSSLFAVVVDQTQTVSHIHTLTLELELELEVKCILLMTGVREAEAGSQLFLACDFLSLLFFLTKDSGL